MVDYERRNGYHHRNSNGNGNGNGSINVNVNGNGNGNGFIYGRLRLKQEIEERESNANGNGNGLSFNYDVDDNNYFNNSPRGTGTGTGTSSAASSCSSSSSPRKYIEHHVTKLDTLAGVAIRYGVEVADIKRMNGLVSDLQMFARKTLHIPLPGRHPPSPCLSNGHTNNSAAASAGRSSCEQTPPRRMRSDILDSLQSLRLTPEHKVSPAMSSLQGYYGLNGRLSEGCEMAVYSKASTNYHEHDYFTPPSSSSMMNPPLNQHRRSRSLANGLNTEEGDSVNEVGTDADKWLDRPSWRRLKSEAELNRTPEKLLKEENGSGSWFSAITGKGLALRTKASSRTNLASEAESSGVNGLLNSLIDSFGGDSSSGVRKSSSTSSLQDQENSNTSIWSASKWSLKPDLQAALAKPIFDGLPKPITGRRAKAALD